MFLTGFADEAGAEFSTQIAATQELNWKFIETRNIGKKNLSTLSDEEFDNVCNQLDDAKIKINCYGSAIANWGKQPRSEADFAESKRELLAALPRMQKLGVKMLRGMSFAPAKDEVPDSEELEKIIFAKVNELVKICADAGVIYGHENCMNYGGLSYLHTLKLLDNIKSENFKLIFDIGNPAFTFRHIGVAPYPIQSAWEFYKNVREFIAHVHIKDCTTTLNKDGSKKETIYCYAGDGCGDVRAIAKDLLATHYDGGFSIEPHIASIFHEADDSTDKKDKIAYSSYIEYGKRLENLLRECGWNF